MAHLRFVASAALATVALACAAAGCTADASTDESDLTNVEKNGGASQKWIYVGMLPKLDAPTIFVSLKAHTARVTGLLPTTFTGDLPFYAVPEVLTGGRTQVTVVYPVATGKIDPTTGKAPAGPGTYSKLFGIAYTPTTVKAAWGGFPFMTYNPGRGLAFHGPITSVYDAEMGDYEWRLTRGPVSHGCQRMQGEHVVELANLLGINMAKPHSAAEQFTLAAKVTISADYDVFEGKNVDVDYPALSTVKRPTTNVQMYKTWDSNDFPRWVCAYDSKRPLDAHHCDAVGENRRDPLSGELLVQPTQDPWVGTECTADATCAFSSGGTTASCLVSGSEGFCTLACEGYCPDKEGGNRTFCVDAGGKGRCMAKAGPENADCADIPGTKVALKDRYIGKSGAKTAQASVCSF